MSASTNPFALYLDNSALVKLFAVEDGSALVRGLTSGHSSAGILLVSRLGYTEAPVSRARMVHFGRIPAADLPKHLGALDSYWEESIPFSLSTVPWSRPHEAWDSRSRSDKPYRFEMVRFCHRSLNAHRGT